MRRRSISRLPVEITMDILSRLPVRLVFQCRSVCKTWLHLINDPRFGKLHHNRALKEADQSLSTFILHCDSQTTNQNEIYLVEEDDGDELEPIFRITKIGVPFTEPSFEVVGSSNGLLCLWSSNNHELVLSSIYIINPVTGESVKLPDFTCDCHEELFIRAAFAFDDSCKSFKVILANIIKSEVQVYTLGSSSSTDSSWRTVGNAPSPLCDTSPIFVNGSIHWLSFEGKITSMVTTLRIVSFYLETEEFSVVPTNTNFTVVLNVDEGYNFHNYQLGVLGGCLTLSDCSLDDCIEIWVMKDYNVKESWTKQFVIGKNMIKDLHTEMPRIHPLFFRKNCTEVLLLYGCKYLLSYNVKSGKTSLEFDVGRFRSSCEAFPHIASLVSLKSALICKAAETITGNRKGGKG